MIAASWLQLLPVFTRRDAFNALKHAVKIRYVTESRLIAHLCDVAHVLVQQVASRVNAIGVEVGDKGHATRLAEERAEGTAVHTHVPGYLLDGNLAAIVAIDVSLHFLHFLLGVGGAVNPVDNLGIVHILDNQHEQMQQPHETRQVTLMRHLHQYRHKLCRGNLAEFQRAFKCLQTCDEFPRLFKRRRKALEQFGAKHYSDVFNLPFAVNRFAVESPAMWQLRRDEHNLTAAKLARTVAKMVSTLARNNIRQFPSRLAMQANLFVRAQVDIVEIERMPAIQICHCIYHNANIRQPPLITKPQRGKKLSFGNSMSFVEN